jgi:uncharacterized membrane protein YcfT
VNLSLKSFISLLKKYKVPFRLITSCRIAPLLSAFFHSSFISCILRWLGLSRNLELWLSCVITLVLVSWLVEVRSSITFLAGWLINLTASLQALLKQSSSVKDHTLVSCLLAKSIR